MIVEKRVVPVDGDQNATLALWLLCVEPGVGSRISGGGGGGGGGGRCGWRDALLAKMHAADLLTHTNVGIVPMHSVFRSENHRALLSEVNTKKCARFFNRALVWKKWWNDETYE